MAKQLNNARQKELIVPADDLAAIHNQLCISHPTGEDIMGVANSIMTLRRLLETSPSYEEPKEAATDAEEVSDATD